jgi:hypothetical protein
MRTLLSCQYLVKILSLTVAPLATPLPAGRCHFERRVWRAIVESDWALKLPLDFG